MAPRAIASGTISFGLVSIPVKVYTATSSKKVRFNMLEAATGARLKQQYISTVSGEVVERSATIKGYEHVRGQFVHFNEEELKALEADRTGAMTIVQFVPIDQVDLVQIEKSYYLGPDKGGDKAYQLLSQAMQRKEQVAVGRWAARGKEQLVLIRPYQEGLILHQLFYADEVRAFDELDTGAELSFAEVELDLADKLVEQLAAEAFEPEAYSDTYTERVRALVDKKVAGEEISVAPEQPTAQIIDLFEALKQSLEAAPAKTKTKTKAKEKTSKKKASKSDSELAPRPVKKASPRKSARGKKASSG